MGCCGNKTKLATTALGALRRVVVAAVTGEQVVAPRRVVESRRALCLNCPSCETWVKNPNLHRCKECGCWLDAKLLKKWSVATERCPVGKWEAV